jgi:hypothetical protein
MAVVIDEMESTVEPDSNSAHTSESTDYQAHPPKPGVDELARNLRHLARRQRRLKAD